MRARTHTHTHQQNGHTYIHTRLQCVFYLHAHHVNSQNQHVHSHSPHMQNHSLHLELSQNLRTFIYMQIHNVHLILGTRECTPPAEMNTSTQILLTDKTFLFGMSEDSLNFRLSYSTNSLFHCLQLSIKIIFVWRNLPFYTCISAHVASQNKRVLKFSLHS